MVSRAPRADRVGSGRCDQRPVSPRCDALTEVRVASDRATDRSDAVAGADIAVVERDNHAVAGDDSPAECEVDAVASGTVACARIARAGREVDGVGQAGAAGPRPSRQVSADAAASTARRRHDRARRQTTAGRQVE